MCTPAVTDVTDREEYINGDLARYGLSSDALSNING